MKLRHSPYMGTMGILWSSRKSSKSLASNLGCQFGAIQMLYGIRIKGSMGCCSYVHMGVSYNLGYRLGGGPHNKDHSILGGYIGSPYFRKLPTQNSNYEHSTNILHEYLRFYLEVNRNYNPSIAITPAKPYVGTYRLIAQF